MQTTYIKSNAVMTILNPQFNIKREIIQNKENCRMKKVTFQKYSRTVAMTDTNFFIRREYKNLLLRPSPQITKEY